jgi:ribosomal protein S18 acetylase RimI-like enzyme
MSGEASSFIAPDRWLAQTLRTPSFVLCAPFPLDAGAVRSGLLACASDGNAFISAKCAVSDVTTVSVLEAAGFHVVDTQITLQWEPNLGESHARASTRLARPEDCGGVLEIAGSCFRYSRFHQDPRIGPAVGNLVKRYWAQNCLDGNRGDEVLVAVDSGSPTGFLAAKKDIVDGLSIATIDLAGVAPSRQRQGIGEALVLAFISRWRERANALRVGTQAANMPSIRLYEACGFRFGAAVYVLHAHVQRGTIV